MPAEIIPFDRKGRQKKKRSDQQKGKTFCSSGFHKWVVETKPQFDVKKGKLITRYKCSRCGKIKISAE